jgi:hypothetical protein
MTVLYVVESEEDTVIVFIQILIELLKQNDHWSSWTVNMTALARISRSCLQFSYNAPFVGEGAPITNLQLCVSKKKSSFRSQMGLDTNTDWPHDRLTVGRNVTLTLSLTAFKELRRSLQSE